MIKGLVAVLLLLLTGCVSTHRNPGIRTRAYLYDAYHARENSQNAEALAAIKRALAAAKCENVPGHVLVEVYDDAGLYFHLAGLHQDSVLHQSVAVLLSRKLEVSKRMKDFYLANLGTALAAANQGMPLDEHATDSERLLAIPGVRENPHIRQYYGR